MEKVKLFMGIAFTVFGSIFICIFYPIGFSEIQMSESIGEIIISLLKLCAASVFFFIGIGFLISYFKSVFYIQGIKDNECKLVCKVKKIHYSNNRPMYFVCEYIDDSGIKYEFKSDELLEDYKIIKNGIVNVYVNPNNFEEYYIDISEEDNSPTIHKLYWHNLANIDNKSIIIYIFSFVLIGGFFAIVTIFFGYPIIMSFLDGNIFESIILAIVVAGILGPMWWLTYISTLRNIKKGKSGRVIKENGVCVPCKIIKKKEYIVHHEEHGSSKLVDFIFEAINKEPFLIMEDKTCITFVDRGESLGSKICKNNDVGDIVNIYVVPDNPFEYVVEYLN